MESHSLSDQCRELREVFRSPEVVRVAEIAAARHGVPPETLSHLMKRALLKAGRMCRGRIEEDGSPFDPFDPKDVAAKVLDHIASRVMAPQGLLNSAIRDQFLWITKYVLGPTGRVKAASTLSAWGYPRGQDDVDAVLSRVLGGSLAGDSVGSGSLWRTFQIRDEDDLGPLDRPEAVALKRIVIYAKRHFEDLPPPEEILPTWTDMSETNDWAWDTLIPLSVDAAGFEDAIISDMEPGNLYCYSCILAEIQARLANGQINSAQCDCAETVAAVALAVATMTLRPARRSLMGNEDAAARLALERLRPAWFRSTPEDDPTTRNRKDVRVARCRARMRELLTEVLTTCGCMGASVARQPGDIRRDRREGFVP